MVQCNGRAVDLLRSCGIVTFGLSLGCNLCSVDEHACRYQATTKYYADCCLRVNETWHELVHDNLSLHAGQRLAQTSDLHLPGDIHTQFTHHLSADGEHHMQMSQCQSMVPSALYIARQLSQATHQVHTR